MLNLFDMDPNLKSLHNALVVVSDSETVLHT